jgi:hypothetical protein
VWWKFTKCGIVGTVPLGFTSGSPSVTGLEGTRLACIESKVKIGL